MLSKSNEYFRPNVQILHIGQDLTGLFDVINYLILNHRLKCHCFSLDLQIQGYCLEKIHVYSQLKSDKKTDCKG